MAITLTSITPDYGPAAGGTAVTLTGTGFVEGATATIGGALITDLVVVDATTITGVTPEGAIGSAVVQVVNPDTEASEELNYCYTGSSDGWNCVRAFPGAQAVLLSSDGNDVLVPRFNGDASIDLFKSTDQGATFAQTTITDPAFVGVHDGYKYFADATLTTLLFPDQSQSLLSTDSGASFSVVDHDGLGCVYAAGSSDGQYLMLLMGGEGAQYSLIQLSTDTGETWGIIDPDPVQHRFTTLAVGTISDDGQIMLVIGPDGEGYSQAVSLNGGADWIFTSGLDVNFMGVCRLDMALDGSVIYASSGSGPVMQSLDYGETWLPLGAVGIADASYNGNIVAAIEYGGA
jgi:hypothetical protein